jgi:hypothetical protein
VNVESKPALTCYHSYLLRLWSVDGAQTWRVMAESVTTHERHSFADLESLFDFLRKQISDMPHTSEDAI